jgi:hypothetical protein
MAYEIPQTILTKLLTALKTAPERLSAQETSIAQRICRCSLCEALWVRRKTKLPDRCPKCHKRAWDRPFLDALMAAQPVTTKPDQLSSPNAAKGGAE